MHAGRHARAMHASRHARAMHASCHACVSPNAQGACMPYCKARRVSKPAAAASMLARLRCVCVCVRVRACVRACLRRMQASLQVRSQRLMFQGTHVSRAALFTHAPTWLARTCIWTKKASSLRISGWRPSDTSTGTRLPFTMRYGTSAEHGLVAACHPSRTPTYTRMALWLSGGLLVSVSVSVVRDCGCGAGG